MEQKTAKKLFEINSDGHVLSNADLQAILETCKQEDIPFDSKLIAALALVKREHPRFQTRNYPRLIKYFPINQRLRAMSVADLRIYLAKNLGCKSGKISAILRGFGYSNVSEPYSTILDAQTVQRIAIRAFLFESPSSYVPRHRKSSTQTVAV